MFENDKNIRGRVTLGPDFMLHPLWVGANQTLMHEFYLGTGAYCQAVLQALNCLSHMAQPMRDVACLAAASRCADEEMSLIYYAASTLSGRWQKVAKALERTRFFSFHPKSWEFISPTPFELRMHESWGVGWDAFMPDPDERQGQRS